MAASCWMMSVALIIKYRELFRANQFDTHLGESTANMYAYSVNTYRIPIIITMNLEEDWETSFTCPIQRRRQLWSRWSRNVD
jgi:hypothetical protein